MVKTDVLKCIWKDEWIHFVVTKITKLVIVRQMIIIASGNDKVKRPNEVAQSNKVFFMLKCDKSLFYYCHLMILSIFSILTFHMLVMFYDTLVKLHELFYATKIIFVKLCSICLLSFVAHSFIL